MVWTQARIIWYMIQDNRRCVNFGRQLQSYTGISRSFAKKKKKKYIASFFLLSASMYTRTWSGSDKAAGKFVTITLAVYALRGLKEQLSSIRLCTSAGRRVPIV